MKLPTSRHAFTNADVACRAKGTQIKSNHKKLIDGSKFTGYHQSGPTGQQKAVTNCQAPKKLIEILRSGVCWSRPHHEQKLKKAWQETMSICEGMEFEKRPPQTNADWKTEIEDNN